MTSLLALVMSSPSGRRAQQLPAQASHQDCIWLNKLNKLIVWRNGHPGAWPSQTSTVAIERHLGKWLSAQRVSHNKSALHFMTERKAFLDTHCPGWSIPSYSGWEARLEELVAWRREHPETWPNQTSDNTNEKRNGRWLSTQRVSHNRRDSWFTAERKELLDTHCPGWSTPANSGWEARFEELVAWRREHPETWPNAISDNITEKRSGQWLNTQRVGYKRGTAWFTAERKELLDTHCPGWSTPANSEWEVRLKELVTWQRGHPEEWPSKTATDTTDRRNGQWLATQRADYKKGRSRFTAERKELLDTHCPGWSISPYSEWETRLEELIAWRKENLGDWPRQAGVDNVETRNGKWLSTQRTESKTGAPSFTTERKALLDSYCPGWAG